MRYVVVSCLMVSTTTKEKKMKTIEHNNITFSISQLMGCYHIEASDGKNAMVPISWGYDRVERTIKNW